MASDGSLLGEGRAYIHLRTAQAISQPCQGTLSLEWWEPEGAAPAALALENGLTVPITVASDRLSGCVVGRILRYQATWPGEDN
jgi:hypothetical protein